MQRIKKNFPKLQEKSDLIKEDEQITNDVATYEELIKNLSKLQSGEEIDEKWYSIYQYYNTNEKYKTKLNNDLKALKFTIQPEVLNQNNINKLYGNTLRTSISKLETYRSCPFSYFLQYGLNLKEKEELKIQTINTGTFLHDVIDEFFNIIKEEEKSLRELDEDELRQIIERIVSEKLTQDKNFVFNSSAKYKLLVTRLKRIVTKALKYIIETIVYSDFEVEGTEVEFKDGGKYKPIRLSTEDGKNIEIVGKIDRLDIAQDENGKYIRIIDYKSSVKDIDLNKVYAGLQLQLLTYLDAVCKVEDFLPAGILYFNILEKIAKANKNISEEEIENKIKSEFKMKGLILADVKVAKMQDKNLKEGSSSNIIPAYIDKSGNLSPKKTSGITAEQFKGLQKYMDTTIRQIVKEIYSGNVEIKPYYKKKATPCKYCQYGTVCGFNYGVCKKNYNFVPNFSKEEIFEKIKQ